jgi:hypothetical protein
MRMLLTLACIAYLVLPSVSYAQTPSHDWASVQALPREVRVIVRELGSRGGHIGGKFLLATETDITVLRAGRPVVIPKNVIARVDQIRRDPVWEGAVIGAIAALVLRAVYAGESCSAPPEPRCTLQGVAMSAGLGALFDLGIDDDRVVYRAAKPPRSPQGRPAATLFRLSF